MRLLSSLIKPSCIVCHKTEDWLCKDCQSLLKAHEDICPICHHYSLAGRVCEECKKKYKPQIEGITIAFKNTPIIKKLIYKFKAKHQKDIWRFFSQFLYRELKRNPFLKGETALSFVPSFWTKNLLSRGYQPSYILAKNLAQNSNLPLLKLCKKIKNTKSQIHLDKEQRKINVLGSWAYIGTKQKLSFDNIVIIDDITTTWTTLNEIAKCIKTQQPNLTIRGIAIARSA